MALILTLASRNEGKRRELCRLIETCDLPFPISIALNDTVGDIEETGSGFIENALLKAKATPPVVEGGWVLGEDSGLIVDALDNRYGISPFPGIYSNRWLTPELRDELLGRSAPNRMLRDTDIEVIEDTALRKKPRRQGVYIDVNDSGGILPERLKPSARGPREVGDRVGHQQRVDDRDAPQRLQCPHPLDRTTETGVTNSDLCLAILKLMEGEANRQARYACGMVLWNPERNLCFDLLETTELAVLSGEPRGTQGFGYDPVMLPVGKEYTMAELDADEKNRISHRGKAFKKALAVLTKHEAGSGMTP